MRLLLQGHAVCGHVGLLCFAFVFPGYVVAVEQSPGSSGLLSADEARTLVDTAAAAIEANYSRARTIRARVHVVTERPGLTNLKEIKVEGPRGTDAIIRNYPKREYTQECLLQDRAYLVSEKHHGREIVRSAVDGRWTYYASDSSVAWIYGTTEAPRRRPCDPRAIGLPTELMPLESYIRNSTTMSARLARSANKQIAYITVSDEKRQTVDFVLDCARHFMPIRITQRRADGSVGVDTTMEYRTINHDALFLDRAVQLFHDRVPNAEVGPINMRLTCKVVECSVLPQPLDKSAFTVNIPPTVHVSDSITGQFVGANREVLARRRPILTWFLACSTVAVIVAYAIVLVRKRLRRA